VGGRAEWSRDQLRGLRLVTNEFLNVLHGLGEAASPASCAARLTYSSALI